MGATLATQIKVFMRKSPKSPIVSARWIAQAVLALQLAAVAAGAGAPLADARNAWAALQSADDSLAAIMGDPAAAESTVAAAQERFDRAQLEFLAKLPLEDALSRVASSGATPDGPMVRRAIYLGAMRPSGQSVRLALRGCESILDRFPETEEATAIRIAILPQLLNQNGSPGRAARRLRQLVLASPIEERPVVRLHLSDALAMTGNLVAARRELHEITSTLPTDETPGLEWAMAGAASRLRLLGSTLGPIIVTRILVGPTQLPKGDWMVVHYWEPWCGPCVTDLPEFDGLWSKLSVAGVLALGMTADSQGGEAGVVDAATVVGRLKLTCPMVVVDQATTGRLGVESRPVTLIMDPDRVVRFASFSSGDSAVVEHAVRALRD